MFTIIKQLFQTKGNIKQNTQVNQPIRAIQDIKNGFFYAIPREKGGYNVLKVLEKDDNGVHVRIYSNVYPNMPVQLNPKDLWMAGILNKSENVDLGKGHLPISYSSFMTWEAIPLNDYEEVTEEQLDGYQYWKEAEGGYF